MPLESGTKISNLNKDYPLPTDQVSEGDDHIGLIKGVLLASFPSDVDIQIPDITGHAGSALIVNETGDGMQWGSSDPGIPTGLICMWSGDSVPEGWLLCDGGGITPDLTGRFVMGHEPGVNERGDTGGANEHRISASQIPVADEPKTFAKPYDPNGSAAKIGDAPTPSPIPTIPTYYVLAYIMKA